MQEQKSWCDCHLHQVQCAFANIDETRATVNTRSLNNLVCFPQVRYNTMAPSILLRQEDEVTVSSGIDATFGSAALDNDVDLSGLVGSSSVVVW